MSRQHAWQQVAAALREEITSGLWPAGTALPTIPLLEERFGVSRITVRRALEQLAGEGLVATGYLDGRRGILVRDTRRTPIDLTPALGSAEETPPSTEAGTAAGTAAGAAAGTAAGTAGLRFELTIAAAPAPVAARLDTGRELVVTRARLWAGDVGAWRSEITYLPRDLAERAGPDEPTELADAELARRLAAAGHQESAWADEVLDEAADPADAARLQVDVGHPLLVHLRTGTSTERITRVTRTVHQGGRVRLRWSFVEPTRGRQRQRRATVPG